jgi:CHAT domain-containing protein
MLSAIILIATLNGCQGLARGYNNPSLTGSIRPEVLKFLKDGRLLDARKALEERYRPQRCGGSGRAGGDLSTQELSVLCDIYARHVAIEEARACLATLECRGVSARKLKEKTAWLDYLTGNFIAAEANSRRASTQGGRYIHALARAQVNEEGRSYARDQAARWVKADDPGTVFQGAQLFAVLGDYAAVHHALHDPFRRVAQDYSENYGEAQTRDLFGRPVASAPLRSDPFHLMRYGVLNRFSFAPRENIYVETLLAESEAELGRYSEAAKRLERLLADPRLPAYVDAHWRALFRRGQVYEQWESDFAAAENRYRESIEVIERTRSLLTTESQRSSFFGNREGPYQAMAALKIAQGDSAGAFEYSERNRSRALVELLATVDRFGPRGVDAARMEALLSDTAEYEIELAELRSKPELDQKSVERLRSLTEEGRHLVQQWPPQMDGVTHVASPKAQQIQSTLSDDETMLGYTRDRQGWRVYVVRNDRPIEPLLLNEDLLKCRDLNKAAEELREALGGDRKQLSCADDVDSLARRLYDVLLGPVEEAGHLQQTARLTILPYDNLHYLPFAALRSPDNRYLVQKYPIALLPSGAIRPYFKRLKRTGSVLAMGDPEFMPRDKNEKPLKGARDEARMVAGSGTVQSEPLLGAAASLDALLSQAPGKDVVHIASHGTFNNANALGSGIKLAQRSPADDLNLSQLYGVQSAWETRLVVLSACQTALGATRPGQEIIGLQRGFLHAGTSGLVATLWRIPDESTVDFMTDFYRAYLRPQKLPAPDALRQAQVKAIQASRPRGDYQWAAFTYTGLHR